MQVSCPNCGILNETTAKFCTECGSTIQSTKGVSSQPTVVTSAEPITKKFYRSRNDSMIFGVCGGLAKYFNMDPSLVRFLTVLLFLFTGGTVLLAYIAAGLIFPYDPSEI